MRKKRKRSTAPPSKARSSRSLDFPERARALILREFGLDQEVWGWFHLKEQPIRSLFAAAAISDGLGTIGLARVDEDDLEQRSTQGQAATGAVTTIYIGREEAGLVMRAIAQGFPELTSASDRSEP